MRGRSIAGWIGKFAISLILIGVLLYLVNIHEVAHRLCSVKAEGLVLAGLATLMAIAARACRWRIICLSYGVTISLWTSFRLVQMGNFAGQVLPASIGGDVVRAWRGCHAGLTLRATVSTILLDRVFGFGTLLVITLVTAPWLLFVSPGSVMLSVLGSGIAIVGLLVLCAVIRLDKTFVRFLRGRLRQEATVLSYETRRLLADRSASVLAVATSAAIHFLSIVTVTGLAAGIGVGVHLYELLILLPTAIFLAAMPFSVAGWGVREGAMVFSLGCVGVSREEAFAVSVLMGIVAAIISLPGCVFMLKDLLSRKGLTR